jgi:hypothetical protein
MYSGMHIEVIQYLKPNLFHNDLPLLGPSVNFSYLNIFYYFIIFSC